MKVKIEIKKKYDWEPTVTRVIESPNLNTAMLSLALECDLYNASAIYISEEEEDD